MQQLLPLISMVRMFVLVYKIMCLPYVQTACGELTFSAVRK